MRAIDVATDQTNTASMPGRYASALFELAKEQDATAQVEADLVSFENMLSESEDLRRLVASPVFAADDQANALAAVLDKAGIEGLTANFFQVIARNRRLFAVPQMITIFKALAAESRGEVTADVTSAQPLSEQQAAELAETLTSSVGKNVKLDVHVDPAILGGLIIKIGSRMIDSSLRTKLTAMKVGLKAAS
jgi:F-type H+-transporting ATPase subunit delta